MIGAVDLQRSPSIALHARVDSAGAGMQVIGSLMAAALLQMDGVRHLHGWQWLFMLEGCATILYGAALWVSLLQGPCKGRI